MINTSTILSYTCGFIYVPTFKLHIHVSIVLPFLCLIIFFQSHKHILTSVLPPVCMLCVIRYSLLHFQRCFHLLVMLTVSPYFYFHKPHILLLYFIGRQKIALLTLSTSLFLNVNTKFSKLGWLLLAGNFKGY